MIRGWVGLLCAGILAAAVGGCRWSTVPKDAVYACSNGGCPSGQQCQQGYCFPEAPTDAGDVDGGCVPKACLPTTCGDLSDGCGATLHCGVCNSPQTCGGAGIPNVCGCVAAPVDAGFVCASADAGCGTLSVVDSCGVAQVYTCGAACSCVPLSGSSYCAAASYLCGVLKVTDNCGRVQQFGCGTCSGPERCHIDDSGASCGPCVPEDDATFCNRHGANCDSLDGLDNCGGQRQAICGVCKSSNGCGAQVKNLCECQETLQGCVTDNQCCTGTCGPNGMCCVAEGSPCGDESDCCAGSCALGVCRSTN